MPITDLATPSRVTDIEPELLEVGGVRLGYKGPKGEPRKLQSFLITDSRMERFQLESGKTAERPIIRLDIMEAIAKRKNITDTVDLGYMKVPKLVELDVQLVYDDQDLNFFTYRASYTAARVLCKGFGAGTEARRYDAKKDDYFSLPCPGRECPWTYEGQTHEHPGCKAHGVLSFVLEDDPMLGGVYVFRTTSPQSIGAIYAGMSATARFTGGRLGGLPMRLRASEKESKAFEGNRPVRRKYTLCTIGFAGDVPAMLGAAKKMFETRAMLNALGNDYEKQLLARMRRGPGEEDPDEVTRIAEEFQPVEQADEPEAEASQAGPALLPPAAELKAEAPAAAAPATEPAPAAGPVEQAERDVLMVLIRAAVAHFGHVAKLREHIAKHDAGPWVQPSKADLDTLRRYATCLRTTGIVPPEAQREPGIDDDIPV